MSSKIIPVSSLNSAYQMSGDGCCDTVSTSGLPLRRISPKKIHCILPSSPWLADSKTNIPLGVLYIAGLLREQGHEVVVTSMLDKRYEGNIHLPESVMDSDVHMFGFCTPQFGEALELAAYIKDRNPDALVVAGGPHPSYEPKEVKEAGRQDAYHFKGTLASRRDYRAADGRTLFDTVIVMEGEVTTLQMLSDWDSGQLQPYYYGDKADAMDLDIIPYPAWDLLPDDHLYNDGVAVMKKRYFESSVRPGTWPVMSMIGARGCPYKCFVAGTPILMADGTARSIESLRIGDLVASFGADLTTLTSQRVLGSGQREADDVYEAEFSNGTVIRATGDHPFWSRDGWQGLRNLEGHSVRLLPNLRGTSEALEHNLREEVLHRRSDLTRQTRRPESDAASRSSETRIGDDATGARSTSFRTTCPATRGWTDSVSGSSGSGDSTSVLRAYEAQQSDAESRSRCSAVSDIKTGAQGWFVFTSPSQLSKFGRTLVRAAAQALGNCVHSFRRSSLLDRAVQIWNAAESRLREHLLPSYSPLQFNVLALGGGYSDPTLGLPIPRMDRNEPLGGLPVRRQLHSAGGSHPDVSPDWVTLTRLTFVGHDIVYPLTVEGTHTFIAAGLATHNCTYCSTPWIGQRPRYRSPANIVGELQKAFDLGIRQVKWQDDTHTLHRTKLREVALAMNSAFGPDSFASRIHTRVNTMDDHIAESLKLMNCKVTCFGIESGSQKVLDANQKGTTVAQNTAALKKAKEHGFYTIAFLVAGMSGETLETARETMAWLKTVKPYLDSCNLAVGIPYPGSRWWTHPQESGIDIVDYNYDNTWIVGFSARDEILVRPHGATVAEMFQIKEEMFSFLVSEGWAKSEWQEDVRIKQQQQAAVEHGVLTAASQISYAGH